MFENIYNNITSPDVNLVGAIVKLVLSMLLGATIGFERRRKGQIAGMRTVGGGICSLPAGQSSRL